MRFPRGAFMTVFDFILNNIESKQSSEYTSKYQQLFKLASHRMKQ